MRKQSLFERLKDLLYRFIAAHIPEASKRYVLYELRDRVPMTNAKYGWFDVSFEEIYSNLRD